MTLILKAAGVTFTDATLPVLYRDSIINANTLYCLDFADTFCWPAQAAPANGAVLNNLTPTGSAASATLGTSKTLGFSGGGFVFDAQTAQAITLPAEGLLTAANTGFLFTTWLKHGTQSNPTDFSMVAGNTYQTGAENQYCVSYQGSTDTYRLYCDASVVQSTGHAVGDKIQFAIAYLPDGSGGYKLRGYKNGARIGSEVATAGALNVPVTTGKANNIGGPAGFTETWCGSVFRLFLENLSGQSAAVAAAQADAQVAKDYAANASRFS